MGWRWAGGFQGKSSSIQVLLQNKLMETCLRLALHRLHNFLQGSFVGDLSINQSPKDISGLLRSLWLYDLKTLLRCPESFYSCQSTDVTALPTTMSGSGCTDIFSTYSLCAYKGPESLLGAGMQWFLACSMALSPSSHDAWLCNMMEGTIPRSWSYQWSPPNFLRTSLGKNSSSAFSYR